MALDRTEIAAHLRDDINKGVYKTGEKLPSYRELATQLGAATNTVGEAVRLLAGEGLVTIRPNSRTVVRSPDEGELSPEERTNRVRSELAQVQAELRDVKTKFTALDQRVSKLLATLDE